MATGAAPIHGANARHVLIVDDAPTVRFYHGAILRQIGFETAEAGNGYEGLEMALKTPYDLMVVDVNMPQMDGHALVQRLRSAEVDISCPVVMISTESQDSDADTAYQSGANLFLIKPVTPELLQRVAEVLTAKLPPDWLPSSPPPNDARAIQPSLSVAGEPS